MTRPLTRPFMVCIERTCPGCGASNRIVTPEAQPSWRINCSRCGTALVDRRGFRPLLIQTAARERDRKPGAA